MTCSENLRAQLAYTLLDARYSDAFATCTATPCAAPNVPIAAGNRIPGHRPRRRCYGALAWAPAAGWRGGVEARALSRVWVNDANSRRGLGVRGASTPTSATCSPAAAST